MSKEIEANTKIIFETLIPKHKDLPLAVYFDLPIHKEDVDRVIAEYPGVYISEIQRTGGRRKIVFMVPGNMYGEVWSEVPERLGASLWGI